MQQIATALVLDPRRRAGCSDNPTFAGVLIAFVLYLTAVLLADPAAVAGVRLLPAGPGRHAQAAHPARRADQRRRAPAQPIDAGELAGELRFEGVRYRYRRATTRRAARRRRRRSRPGSGSRWSAGPAPARARMMKLAARFYDPTEGRVLVDGHDLRDLEPDGVPATARLRARRSRSCSPASIRDNVAYGRPDATDDEVERVCREVGLATWVETLPDGYDTAHHRARPVAVGRSATAGLPRPRTAGRPGDPAAGRGDRDPRPGRRGRRHPSHRRRRAAAGRRS